MKYLTYIIEHSNIPDVHIELKDIQQFYKDKEKEIYENLDLFITEDLNQSYYNIRNYIISNTVSYINEISLKLIGAGTLMALGAYLYSSLTSWWDAVKPLKFFSSVEVDPHQIKEIDQFTDGFFSKTLFSPTEAAFLNNPLFILVVLASTFYAGTSLVKQYQTIRKIAAMKDNFDAIFKRLDALGVSEATKSQQFNQDKYNSHLSRCKQSTEKTFDVISINIGCPLDAYLTYCSSMILSLSGIYISTLKERYQISSILNLLAVKENFMVNQFLNTMYNQFSDALDFIFQDDLSIKRKWLLMIDTNINELARKSVPSVASVPQISHQNDRSNYKRFDRKN